MFVHLCVQAATKGPVVFVLRLLFREQLKSVNSEGVGDANPRAGGGRGKHLNSVFTKLRVVSKRSSLINTDLYGKRSSLPLKSAEGMRCRCWQLEGGASRLVEED